MDSSRLTRQMRRAAGFTQAELALRSGIARPVISYYERGQREPSATALARLAEAAGFRLMLTPRQAIDESANDRALQAVLDLAEHLPARRRPADLDFPPLRGRR